MLAVVADKIVRSWPTRTGIEILRIENQRAVLAITLGAMPFIFNFHKRLLDHEALTAACISDFRSNIFAIRISLFGLFN